MSRAILTFKRDFAQEIRRKHDVTLAEARAIMETVYCLFVDGLYDGKAIRLGEIGLLLPSLVKARKRFHQSRGEVVAEAEHRGLRLRVTKEFRARFRLGTEVVGKLRVSKGFTAAGRASKRVGEKSS